MKCEEMPFLEFPLVYNERNFPNIDETTLPLSRKSRNKKIQEKFQILKTKKKPHHKGDVHIATTERFNRGLTD